MANKTNVVEINGRRYDAVSGELLGAAEAPKTVKTTQLTRRGRNLDGVVRTPKTAAKTASVSVAPKKSRAAAPTAKPHQAERSKTLVRHAVKKPALTKKPAIKTTAPAKRSSSVPMPSIEIKRFAHGIDPLKAKLAQKVPQSKAISRFGNTVRVAPKPIFASFEPVQPPAASPLTDEKNMFERAIEKATAHENKPHRAKKTIRHHAQKHRKTAGAMLVAFFVLTTAAFAAYNNTPQIELQIASLRAGFSGTMPGYTPAGFAKSGPAKYGDKTVSLTFATTDKRRSYHLSQTQSTLNSSGLYEHVVASTRQPYKTVQNRGITVYIYGDAQAAWVSGGVLYQITGNALLNNDQIVKIASSL